LHTVLQGGCKLSVEVPVHVERGNFCTLTSQMLLRHSEYVSDNQQLFVLGGRSNALELLSDLSRFADYTGYGIFLL
jgi:hypothetical protein